MTTNSSACAGETQKKNIPDKCYLTSGVIIDRGMELLYAACAPLILIYRFDQALVACGASNDHLNYGQALIVDGRI